MSDGKKGIDFTLDEDKGLFDENATAAIMRIESRKAWIVERLDNSVNRLLEMLENKTFVGRMYIRQFALKIDRLAKEIEKNSFDEIAVFSLLILLCNAMETIQKIGLLDGIDKKTLHPIYFECFLPVKLFIESCFYGNNIC